MKSRRKNKTRFCNQFCEPPRVCPWPGNLGGAWEGGLLGPANLGEKLEEVEFGGEAAVDAEGWRHEVKIFEKKEVTDAVTLDYGNTNQ